MLLSLSPDVNVLFPKGEVEQEEEEEAEEEEEEEEEEAGLFSILHMFQGYSALIISVHHTVTHRDYLDTRR